MAPRFGQVIKMALEEFLGIPLDFVLKVFVLPGFTFIFMSVMLAVWFERKFLARMMLRVGPSYVGRYAGALQIPADFMKLLSKEIIIPRKADKFFFAFAPIIFATIPALGLAVIPFAENWFIYETDYSLLFVLMTIALMVPTVLLIGYASNNKYSFIGSLRGAIQYLGYEVPLILSAISIVALARSLDLIEITKAQSLYWFIPLQPIGAIVFFVSMLAEMERLPFDLPEAPQEIVIGYLTEYGGVYYAMLMYGAYVRFLVCSLLFTILFLGGWQGLVIIHPIGTFLFKVSLVVTFIMLLRGSLPRTRIDQLLRIGWRILTPLALLSILWSLFILAMGVV